MAQEKPKKLQPSSAALAKEKEDENKTTVVKKGISPGVPKSTPRSVSSRLLEAEKQAIDKNAKENIVQKESKEKKTLEKKDLIENDLQILKDGSILLKVPTKGPPKKTKFYVQNKGTDEWIIFWDSKNKLRNDTTFKLKGCSCSLGQGQGKFKDRKVKSKGSGHSRLSFTLSFESDERTIDVTAPDVESFDRWCRVLRHIGVCLDTKSGY